MILLGRKGTPGGFLKIRPHELTYGSRVMLERSHALLDGLDQGLEGGEIAVVGLVALDVAPQMLDGIIVRRVGRQPMDRQALGVLGHEGARRSSGMVTGTIVDDHNGLGRLRQNGREKGTVPGRRKALGAALEKQAPAEI